MPVFGWFGLVWFLRVVSERTLRKSWIFTQGYMYCIQPAKG